MPGSNVPEREARTDVLVGKKALMIVVTTVCCRPGYAREMRLKETCDEVIADQTAMLLNLEMGDMVSVSVADLNPDARLFPTNCILACQVVDHLDCNWKPPESPLDCMLDAFWAARRQAILVDLYLKEQDLQWRSENGKNGDQPLRLGLPPRQWSAKRAYLSNRDGSIDGDDLLRLRRLVPGTVLSLEQIGFCQACLQIGEPMALSLAPIQRNSFYCVSPYVEEGLAHDRSSSDRARLARWQMQVCSQTLGGVRLGEWWVGWC